MNNIICKSVLTVLCIILFQSLFAQSIDHRPGIGLTLSGGGAKGLAHIGILEAIDSAGLKIDYITGTSMGSMIGGLYAAGYSGDTIEAIARSLDWDLLFSISPQINFISIEEKKEFNKYAIEIPFEHGKFQIGKGFIEGQELWLKLAELFQPVYKIIDFHQLPIPFECIGTDLSTGNVVVMDHGNISNCIRASLAIPGVFTPGQYEGKTVIDGAIVNNFPIMEVKKMGADIVIGVNLYKGLDKAEDLETALAILLQIGNFKDAADFEKHRQQCDIYITPGVQDFSPGNFDISDSIIDIGKKCGLQYYPVFKHLADSLNALYPSTEPFSKNRLPEVKPIFIGNYTVPGLEKTSDKFFLGLSDSQAGETLSNKRETESIRLIYGSRYYKSIKYDLIPVDSTNTEFRFNAEENLLTSVKFAFNYNDYTKLNFIGNITKRDLLFKESRAIASVSLSANPRLLLDYYKYLGQNRKLGLDLAWYKEFVDFPLYKDFRLFETLRSNYSQFTIRGQYNINRNSFIGLSQQYNRSLIKTIESPPVIFNGKDKFWHTFLSYRLHTLDHKYFATKGWNVKSDVGYIYHQEGEITITEDSLEYDADSSGYAFKNLPRISLRVDHFIPLSEKIVLLQQVSFAHMFNKDPYPASAFQVGGIEENVLNQVPFVGLTESEVKSGSILNLQVGLQWNVAGIVYLIGRANAAVYDFYKVDFDELSARHNFLSGYSLSAGAMTPLGPIEIAVMYSDQDGKVRTNLNLGYRF